MNLPAPAISYGVLTGRVCPETKKAPKLGAFFVAITSPCALAKLH